MDHERRLDACRTRWQDAGVDGLLVTNLTNVRYLTGFSGTNGQVLVSANGATFFTDPRYEARAGQLVEGADVVIYPARLTDVLPQHLSDRGIRKLGVEGPTMTLSEREDLAPKLPGTELVTTRGVVEGLRRSKDADEIALIRAAVALADDAFAHILDRLVPGVAERDIALELELHMRRAGAEAVAFPPIVGSGPLSAHIHHSASERLLEKGDVVLLDLGCMLQGYCSDLTRTVVLGAARDDDLALYDLVARAQLAGIAAVAPGRHGAEVDRAARDVIGEAGHAEHFGHGLGHGVGLDIHEAPRLHKISEDTLAPGDVVTVEPGVYLPGHAGVRIEDCVLVTDDGAEVLGAAPKERFIEL